jgi:hypothetical protein
MLTSILKHWMKYESIVPNSKRLETKSTPMIRDAPDILAPSAA